MKKNREVWAAEYKGHSIRIIEKSAMVLTIDGEEVDKSKGLLIVECTLKGRIPNTDETVVVFFSGKSEYGTTVSMIVGTELEVARGTEQEDGSFKAYTAEEIEQIKENQNAAQNVANLLNLL